MKATIDHFEARGVSMAQIPFLAASFPASRGLPPSSRPRLRDLVRDAPLGLLQLRRAGGEEGGRRGACKQR